MAEVRFGQVWSGSVEFGLVKVGVIWFSLIWFGPSTDKQTKKMIIIFLLGVMHKLRHGLTGGSRVRQIMTIHDGLGGGVTRLRYDIIYE